MSTITVNQTSVGPVIQGRIPSYQPYLEPDSHFSLLINAPEILYTLEAPLAATPIIEDDRIVAKFTVDSNVDLDLTLTGKWVENEGKFQPEQFSLFYQIKESRPRAHFIAATLMAVMGLAGKFDLQISEPEVSTTLNFELPLLEISKLLHRRQFTYRLMVIEEATGARFLLPSTISEKDIKKIAFVYHAIVDRSFVWSSERFKGTISATEEWFVQGGRPFAWEIESLSETVLGQSINLGSAKISTEDAVIQRPDEVQQQLAAMDGRQIPIMIRSFSGRIRYDFTEAPLAPDLSRDSKIQALIDIEPQLDVALVQRYHALAAATLDGLTEEEKKEVTTRPELGEAFLIDRSNGE